MSGRVQTLESKSSSPDIRCVRCVDPRLQNLYAGSGKEKIIDAVFEQFQYDLEEAFFFQWRLQKVKFKWKRWKDIQKTWKRQRSWVGSFQKKTLWSFTRPFSRMGAGFIVVHVVLLGRSMTDGGLKANPSLRSSSTSVGSISTSCVVGWNRSNIGNMKQIMKIMLWV